jgi:hypothetical protein
LLELVGACWWPLLVILWAILGFLIFFVGLRVCLCFFCACLCLLCVFFQSACKIQKTTPKHSFSIVKQFGMVWFDFAVSFCHVITWLVNWIDWKAALGFSWFFEYFCMVFDRFFEQRVFANGWWFWYGYFINFISDFDEDWKLFDDVFRFRFLSFHLCYFLLN